MDAPETHQRVAHNEIDFLPIERQRDVVDSAVEDFLIRRSVNGFGINESDLRSQLFVVTAERPILPGQHFKGETGMAGHVGGVFQKEKWRTL